jgi:hypothetical protein
MNLENVNSFGENIALFINGRFPEVTFNSIKNGIRAKGKKIIPILYKTENDFPIAKVGINFADELYIVNARPLNEKTRQLTNYADSTNKKYKIFNDVKEII